MDDSEEDVDASEGAAYPKKVGSQLGRLFTGKKK
jgi:hypothetical protein